MMSLRKALVAATVCSLAASGAAWCQTSPSETAPSSPPSVYKPTVGQSGKDVVWVPTSQALVDRMLDMVKLTPQDRLVDLGSGDGRMVITAAKRGATARGIEFNPDMVELSRQAAKAEGVSDRARFERADIFQSDFSDATVVTLFLLPDLNLRLRPTLLNMKPGTRVVSNTFMMDDWEPDESVQAVQGCGGHCSAHKWIVPAKVAGTWSLGDREMVLTQKFQKIEGSVRGKGGSAPITEGRIEGTRISFMVGNERYTGEINGTAMQGKTERGTPWRARLRQL
ncbi:methyltransferase family protein [Cupriavidus gilardii J11]|uniref:Methyltransferase family protein n=1 Tax=Cupriavidus gilardii J11 TaxID=936133 RepID=A0A562BE13_9BURK|nr:class I SAM-dependent methyltransferase [Cupriavidus gilardii]TWG83361.1 methyltransferase family protein [Cupriavidus gilardii J11]